MNFDSINSKCFQECEQGWTLHNGKCYFYNSVSLDNESAKRWCSEYGATLMNIHNQDDFSFALSINQIDDSFWVYNVFKRIFKLKNIKTIIFGLKVGGTAIEMFKYQLPDGSVFDNSLFCQGNF
jgi:hypothetical protein